MAHRSDLLETVVIDGAGGIPYRFGPLVKLGVDLFSPFLHTRPVLDAIARTFAMDEQGVEDLRRASPEAFRRALNDANAQRMSRAEVETPCRTLLVAGENDLPMVRPSNAALADLMDDAEARFVPGLGHGWIGRNPTLHRRMVAAWIAGTDLPSELRRETTPWPRGRVDRLLRERPS